MKAYRDTDHAEDILPLVYDYIYEGVDLYDSWGEWLTDIAQPKHYLIAAAMAQEGSKE